MDSAIKDTIFAAVVTIHALLLMRLGLRRRSSRHPAVRFILLGMSTAYLPLMSFVLSHMTTNLWTMGSSFFQVWLLASLILVQFVKAKADMEAQAVTAVVSPVAGDDDVNSLKVRPSKESVVYSFWVAGLVIYNIFFGKGGTPLIIILPFLPLWALGGARMVLRFFAFDEAADSFAFGRNVQLIQGYMAQLQQDGGADRAAVPRLIVTGEEKEDIEESSLGYRVRPSALENKTSTSTSSLVTLDRIRSETESELDPQVKDLCLSFALFKCLRRRFAGYPLAEAGSSWAFRFVSDGLLGPQDDHERIFRVIASELTFASDFYYSPLPVASLGSRLYTVLYVLLSVLIFSWLCLLVLLLIIALILFVHDLDEPSAYYVVPGLPVVLGVVIAWMEMSEMLASVRSNWTKMSIVGHYIRCPDRRLRWIFAWLLGLGSYKTPKQWKDEIGQVDLLANHRSSCARPFIGRQKHTSSMMKVPAAAKAAILRSFQSSGGQLSAGTAAVQRRRLAFCHDITWACLDVGEITTTTDAILVWCVATGLLEKWCSSRSQKATSSMSVAVCLSRYCAYLVAEVPALLPDSSAWTKHYYQEVKKSVEAALQRSGCVGADLEEGAYHHEVLKRGSRLAMQLLDEAEKQRSEEAGAAGGEDAVWELLAEFWSEMLLYVAPSDNVKGHIEVLQRGGELITLLWVLLLHAGITTRPAGQSSPPRPSAKA